MWVNSSHFYDAFKKVNTQRAFCDAENEMHICSKHKLNIVTFVCDQLAILKYLLNWYILILCTENVKSTDMSSWRVVQYFINVYMNITDLNSEIERNKYFITWTQKQNRTQKCIANALLKCWGWVPTNYTFDIAIKGCSYLTMTLLCSPTFTYR